MNTITQWDTTAYSNRPVYVPFPSTTTTASFTAGPITKSRRAWMPKWLRSLGLTLASERGGAMSDAGAVTKSSTTAKKKITLERTEGVPRDKGSGIEEIHHGSIELVRSVEGTANQIESIGIKANPKGGSSFVEIPIADLLEAIKDLEATHVVDVAQAK